MKDGFEGIAKQEIQREPKREGNIGNHRAYVCPIAITSRGGTRKMKKKEEEKENFFFKTLLEQ